jgi:hypothetical protein
VRIRPYSRLFRCPPVARLEHDGRSRDATVAVVQTYQATHPLVPLRLFVNDVNRGVARNFFERAFRARGRYYRLVCGDDVEPIESHEELLRHIGAPRSWSLITPPSKAAPTIGTSSAASILGWSTAQAAITSTITTAARFTAASMSCAFTSKPPGSGTRRNSSRGSSTSSDRSWRYPLCQTTGRASGSVSLRNASSVVHSLLKIALRRLRVYLYE